MKKQLANMIRLYEQHNYPTKASLNEVLRFFCKTLENVPNENIEKHISSGADTIILDENGLTFYDFCRGEQLTSIQREEWNNLTSFAGMHFLLSVELNLRSEIAIFQMHDLVEASYKEEYYKKVTELFNQEHFQSKVKDGEFCFSIPLSCFE